MTSTEHEPDDQTPDTTPESDGDSESGAANGPLTEDDYALGSTSDPEGASSSEPAGEDYAGSGF